MNLNKLALSTAVTALVSMAFVSNASAYTSAGSKVEYENLLILIDGADPASQPLVTNYNFVTTNTTTLQGSTIADSDSCAGTISPFVNSCSATTPRLDSDLQVLGSSTHTENDFNLDGPNAGTTYSYSDSVITTAQLTGDPTTSASLIAETEMLETGGGNSSSTIQSTTGFDFTFLVDGAKTFSLSFLANPEAYAASDNPGSILTIAESSIAATFTLVQNSGGTGKAEWTPNGQLTGCSSLTGGLTCTDEIDGESLNQKTAVSTDPASDLFSNNGATFSNFGLTINGLTDGLWTFSLTTTVANSVSKVITGVPEPGTMLLLGAGLAGLGFTRRRKQAQV